MDFELVAEIISNVFPAAEKLLCNADEVQQKDRFWIVPGKEGWGELLSCQVIEILGYRVTLKTTLSCSGIP